MLISSFEHYAFVGIGSNLGSAFGGPKENVLEAVERLKKFSEEPVLVAPLIESKPQDCPPGSPDFVNTVIALVPEADEVPLGFLQKLLHIENSMGRVRSGIKNEARIIDLDLLLFQEAVQYSEELNLPHPEMLKRKFVLQPLKELLEAPAVEACFSFAKKNSAVERS